MTMQESWGIICLWRLAFFPSSLHVGFLSFPYVDRHAIGEGDVIGGIEALQAHMTHADAELVGHQGAQELAALARLD